MEYLDSSIKDLMILKKSTLLPNQANLDKLATKPKTMTATTVSKPTSYNGNEPTISESKA